MDYSALSHYTQNVADHNSTYTDTVFAPWRDSVLGYSSEKSSLGNISHVQYIRTYVCSGWFLSPMVKYQYRLYIHIVRMCSYPGTSVQTIRMYSTYVLLSGYIRTDYTYVCTVHNNYVYVLPVTIINYYHHTVYV